MRYLHTMHLSLVLVFAHTSRYHARMKSKASTPKPPTILQILPELNSGGVERGVVDMARAIVEASGVALVVSSGGRLVESLKAAGAVHITLPVASKNPLRIKANVSAIQQILRQHNVDIVHARSRAPAWSAYHAARYENIPFITTFHGVYGLSGLGKQKYNSVMVKGERVIAVSHYIADHITRHYPEANPDHVRVIHRGVDTECFRPDAVVKQRIMQLIQDWHLQDMHAPILFMPARITRWKGQHVVLQALAALPHRNFICLFAGEADKHPRYYRDLHQMVNTLKLERNVRFVEATQHMPEAYALSTLVLAPSVEPESFGRVVVEAQAMGKPVIATSHGGAMETVVGRETGWLVAPNDVAALSAAIEEVLAMSEDARDAHSRVVRAYAKEHFSLASMQDKTLNVYEEVMRASRR
jgi:glycosyltransferase involved in cell wall biosynthesis